MAEDVNSLTGAFDRFLTELDLLPTNPDNRQWVCELHLGFDENLNLYFRSKKDRRHSLEIESNSSVAGLMR